MCSSQICLHSQRSWRAYVIVALPNKSRPGRQRDNIAVAYTSAPFTSTRALEHRGLAFKPQISPTCTEHTPCANRAPPRRRRFRTPLLRSRQQRLVVSSGEAISVSSFCDSLGLAVDSASTILQSCRCGIVGAAAPLMPRTATRTFPSPKPTQ